MAELLLLGLECGWRRRSSSPWRRSACAYFSATAAAAFWSAFMPRRLLLSSIAAAGQREGHEVSARFIAAASTALGDRARHGARRGSRSRSPAFSYARRSSTVEGVPGSSPPSSTRSAPSRIVSADVVKAAGVRPAGQVRAGLQDGQRAPASAGRSGMRSAERLRVRAAGQREAALGVSQQRRSAPRAAGARHRVRAREGEVGERRSRSKNITAAGLSGGRPFSA